MDKTGLLISLLRWAMYSIGLVIFAGSIWMAVRIWRLGVPLTRPGTSPRTISVDQLGIIEANVGDLTQVVVLCDRIEDPHGSLRDAVIRNFEDGVRYLFVISPTPADEKARRQEYFTALWTAAGRGSVEHLRSLTELFTVQEIDGRYTQNPYVFYIYEENKIFAYRGVDKSEGITDTYELLTDETTSNMYAILQTFVLGRDKQSLPPPDQVEIEKPTTAQVIELNGRVAAR